MKATNACLSVLFLCLLTSAVISALTSDFSGFGSGGGRRRDRDRDAEEPEGDTDEQENSPAYGGRGRDRGGSRGGDGSDFDQDLLDSAVGSRETNTGYTIQKLYGDENDPPLAGYPRKIPTGELDTQSMYTLNGVPRPPQKIRLRGNRTDMNPNEGRVEVQHDGSWGLVCDDHFGDNEANVACKSLGFSKGANNYYSDSFFGTGKFRQRDILMAQVRCSPHGDEKELTQCTHNHATSQCTLADSAGVECKYNEGCEWGWIGYDGLCYRVQTALKTADEAAGQCAEIGGSLAYVLSSGENNFISNVMHTKYKNISAIWTAGQFAKMQKRRRTAEDWVFKDSDHVIKQDSTFWFPGFADGSSPRPKTDERKRSCLALSKIFFRRDTNKDTDVNYFWWDNVSCKTQLPYICQKLAVSTDCYNGTGATYKGHATRTEDGSLCEKWGADNPDLRVSQSSYSSSSYYSSGSRRRNRDFDARRASFARRRGSGGGRGSGSSSRSRGSSSRSSSRSWAYASSRSIGRRTYGYGQWDTDDHNYCRNADGDTKPWCWIDKKQSVMGYCNIRQCGNSTGRPSVAAPKNLSASFNSSMCQRPDQFFCPSMINYRPSCVGKVDVCDSYKDCVGGEDENPTFCKSYKCKPTEFYCNRTHRCIPMYRVCDKHYDCDYGDDETPAACKLYRPETGDTEADILKRYSKSTNVDLETSTADAAVTVTYYTLSLSQCAAKCDRSDPTALATCGGFLYSSQGTYGSQCVLLGDKLPSVTSGETALFTYYEKIATCSDTQFVCKNSHCIAKSLKCNGYDDCGDLSDEIGPEGCRDPKPTFNVRLTGGKGPYEGIIEVKLFNEWGLVCDNGLDASMGNLVCRQLGYPLGYEKLSYNARREFGRGSGKYMMSSANCSGVTTSLYDCPHAGWKVGNCSVNNVAGLICRRQRACTIKEFRCADHCAPLSAVCNGVRDCPDGADEAACKSMTLVLSNGNQSSNGVLEVSRGGILGAVCDDTFGDKEVQVACRHLGFGTGRGQKLPTGTFKTPENLVMWVQDVRCRGTESDLFSCNITNWGRTVCDVSEAVNIQCGLSAATTAPTTRAPTTTAPSASSGPSVTGCGQRIGRFPAGRIVNGYPATAGQFPWQVGIRLRLSSTESQQWCGGTIISDRWIVTASHCFEEYPKSSYILRIGDVDNTVKEAAEREFDIDLLIKHQKYAGNPTFDYDITLLRIKPDRQGFITFNEAVQPACLPDKNLVAPKNTVCHISGWGSVGTLDLPKNLMAANVPLIENAKCNQMYPNRITERMQCAGFEAGGIDSCQGDSGGPLVCKIDDRFVLLGATSWGEGCALPGAPGVYANVRNLRDWIDQTIRSNP